jgi:hypothetical protein
MTKRSKKKSVYPSPAHTKYKTRPDQISQKKEKLRNIRKIKIEPF